MIPPVEERAVRPCNDCVFAWEDDYTDLNCNLHVYTRKYIGYTTEPCKYHYTDDEMKELIDSGRV
jgi:hypothetical protein